MPLLSWMPMFSVGVAEIDDQHKKLIALANQLNDSMSAGKGRVALDKVFSELVAYTQTHFADEEALMVLHGYSGIARHQDEHRTLVSQVVGMKNKYDRGEQVLTTQVMAFLRDWLTRHIVNSDKAVGRELNAKGVK